MHRHLLAALIVSALCSLPSSAWSQDASASEQVSAPEVGEAMRVAKGIVLSAGANAQLEGLPIVAYDFSCRALPECKTEEGRELFKRLSKLEEGAPYSSQDLLRAQALLAKTGLFANLETQKTLVPGGVRVEIDALGAILIRDIDIDGAEAPPFLEDIRRVLVYREGQIFTGDPQKERVQKQSLGELYEKEGFFETDVSIEPVFDPEVPNAVDLVISIERGRPRRLCRVGFRGVKVFEYPEARTLVLEGSTFWQRQFDSIAPDELRHRFNIPRYASKELRVGIEALIAAYRDRGYFQARVVGRKEEPRKVTRLPDDASRDQRREAERARSCVDVALDVSEGPRWQLEFAGASNDVFTTKELRELLPFINTGYVDQRAVEDAARLIERSYATRGYPLARVQGKEVRRDRLDRTLVYSIEEGPKLEITEIAFDRDGAAYTGFPELSNDALRAQMGTKVFAVFGTGGFLQIEQLLNDMSRIESVYRDLGFVGASVPWYRVVRDDDGLRITIRIEEGQRSVISGSSTESETEIPCVDAARGDTLKVAAGQPLRVLDVQTDRARLVRLYGACGYPMADVVSQCVVGGEPRVCKIPERPPRCAMKTLDDVQELNPEQPACTARGGAGKCFRVKPDEACSLAGGIDSPSTRVVHVVKAGPRVSVGDVLIRGAFDTNRDFIGLELPLREGELFDVSQLLQGQANLRSLGLFDSVSVEAIGLDAEAASKSEATAAVVISVEESNDRYVDVNGGLLGLNLTSGDQARRLLVLGSGTFNSRNLRGRGQRIQPKATLAADVFQLIELSQSFGNVRRETFFTDLANEFRRVDVLANVEVAYTVPRFLRKSLNVEKLTLSVAPYYALDYLGVIIQGLQREEFGVRAELRKELFELLDRLFVTVGVQGKNITTRDQDSADFTPDGFLLFEPRRVTGKFYLEGSIDRRDNPLNPRKGWVLQVSPQLVSGAAQAVGTSATQDPRGDVIGDAFTRLTATGSYYVSIARSLIFGQKFQYGHIVPIFGRAIPVPSDERYVLGGVSSVRGFPEGGLIARYDEFTQIRRGGEFIMNLNTELRLPLVASQGLWTGTFVDVGVLADCFSDLRDDETRVGCYADAFPAGGRLSKVRASAGLGLRYLIAGQIPLLLDYAVVLNRRPGESFGNLHFNVGYSF